jgi:hypothetical protein
MSCVAAPPSDHEAKEYEVPPSAWGDGAEMLLLDRRITVRVNGVVAVVVLSESVRPDGLEAKCRSTVLGSMRTLSTSFSPAESVAVSRSSR